MGDFVMPYVIYRCQSGSLVVQYGHWSVIVMGDVPQMLHCLQLTGIGSVRKNTDYRKPGTGIILSDASGGADNVIAVVPERHTGKIGIFPAHICAAYPSLHM